VRGRCPDHVERRIRQLGAHPSEGVEQDVDALDRVESAEVDDRRLARARDPVRARDIQGGRDRVEACGIRALGEVVATFRLGQVETRRGFANRSPRPQGEECPLDGRSSALTRCREHSVSLENVRYTGPGGRSSAENADGAVNVLEKHDVEFTRVLTEP